MMSILKTLASITPFLVVGCILLFVWSFYFDVQQELPLDVSPKGVFECDVATASANKYFNYPVDIYLPGQNVRESSPCSSFDKNSVSLDKPTVHRCSQSQPVCPVSS